jgi:hypothetical protein
VHALPQLPQLAESVVRLVQSPPPPTRQQVAPASVQNPPVPQEHAPFKQDDAVIELHGLHVAPPAPQAFMVSAESAVQVPGTPPAQQPFGHVLASHAHAPVVRSQRPLLQDVHIAPLMPQEEGDWALYFTHAPVFGSQHPSGHDVESQTHCPALLQSWPLGHVIHVLPAAPHVGVPTCEL